jgi:hypothetical protein
LHADLKRRWLVQLPTEQRELLDISTLLDPRSKEYKFPGLLNTDLTIEKEASIDSRGRWTGSRPHLRPWPDLRPLTHPPVPQSSPPRSPPPPPR